MQAIDWNDLRHVLAVAREGSYVAAARQLGLDPTTVARRVRALETALHARLFERGAMGELHLTESGEVAVRRAEAVEVEVGGLTAAVQGADATVSGTVRVTAVPILTNRVLVPAAAGLLTAHPSLRVELVSDARDLSLTRREADIAVRLARPGHEVGDRVVARRVGTLAYAAYAAEGQIDASGLPWLGYEDGMAHLPQARWLFRAGQMGGGFSALAVNDAEALLQAVQAGLGRSLLPCIVADRVTSLARVRMDELPLPEREVWVLTHADLRHLARIRAVLAWIEAAIEGR